MVTTPGTALVVTRGVAAPSTSMTTRRTVAPAVLGTGLGAPEFRAFRERLDQCLRHVADVWPRAHVLQMRSAMLTEALRTRQLLAASDSELQAFLLYAAETQLDIGHQLSPVVDVDPRTQQVTIAAVEKVAGLVDLIRRAGARDVTSGTVFAADTFHNRFADGDRDFCFEPNLTVRHRGEIVAFFAVIDLPLGKWSAKVLSVEEVQQLRAASRNPTHVAWRDYFARMGELSALRAIADWIPRGHDRARPSRVDEVATPMLALDPENPYATAPATAAAPIDTPADRAASECLPGNRNHFDGWGGQPIGTCPSRTLRGVRRWIRASPGRTAQYATLLHAITLVLTARVADAAHSPSAGATR